MPGKSDYDDLFELLNSARVKFLVVGAYAVAFHAVPRNTGDIDLFISSDEANAKRVLGVIREFGFGGLGVTLEDLTKPDVIIQLGYPPLRVDFLTGISGVKFDDAWKSRMRGRIGDSRVWFISKPDLVMNKRQSGRPKDKLDLKLLRTPRKRSR